MCFPRKGKIFRRAEWYWLEDHDPIYHLGLLYLSERRFTIR